MKRSTIAEVKRLCLYVAQHCDETLKADEEAQTVSHAYLVKHGVSSGPLEISDGMDNGASRTRSALRRRSLDLTRALADLRLDR